VAEGTIRSLAVARTLQLAPTWLAWDGTARLMLTVSFSRSSAWWGTRRGTPRTRSGVVERDGRCRRARHALSARLWSVEGFGVKVDFVGMVEPPRPATNALLALSQGRIPTALRLEHDQSGIFQLSARTRRIRRDVLSATGPRIMAGLMPTWWVHTHCCRRRGHPTARNDGGPGQPRRLTIATRSAYALCHSLMNYGNS
jgi:hypothetical protein